MSIVYLEAIDKMVKYLKGLNKIKSNIVLDTIMSSIEKVLDRGFLQHKLEPTSLQPILTHLNTNNLKSISSLKIVKYDLDKLVPYSRFMVDGKTENEQKYTYLIHSGEYYKIVDLYKISKPINPELEPFTLDYKKAKYFKGQYNYNLTLLQKTNFDIDISDDEAEIKKNIQKYTLTEKELEARKKALEDKWRAEIKSLYDEKNALIKINKDLYVRRLELSKQHYSSAEQGDKKSFLDSYRTILKQSGENQDKILEINKVLEVLEKKANLYLSETYFYYPTSIITITSVNKEQYDNILGGLQTSVKTGGYELEYLDLDNLDDIETIQSYYKDVKERIKKLSKKHNNVTNKELMNEISLS
jgi:hypothetical protein